MDKKLTYIVIATTAILHDGKRYGQGDKIELTASEAENLSLYIQLDQTAEKTTNNDAESDIKMTAETAAETEPQAVENKQKSAKSAKSGKATDTTKVE